MLEFNSSSLLGKRVRRKIRKKYKRYKIGITLSAIFTSLLIFAEYTAWNKLIEEPLTSRLMLCIGIAVIPSIVILATVLVSISGGADIMKNISERVVISMDSLLYEVVPDARFMPGISLVAYKYKWDEITKIIPDSDFARLTIWGSGYLIKYRDISKGNIVGNVEKSYIKELSITLYEDFVDFEKMKSEIINKLGSEKINYVK